MYRLLVVDDEELIRQGLLARLSFLGLAFDAIWEASSGREGLLQMEAHPADIVITDIEMPDMDGLTFLDEIRRLYPQTKFILLSGYAEFSYAEKAISLGVKAYLLKPISNQELKEAVDKCMESVQQKAQMRDIVFTKKRLQKEKSSYLLEREINAAVTGQMEEGETAQDRYPYLNANYPGAFGGGALILGIIAIDANSYDNGSFSREDAELLRFSIRNVFYDIPSACTKVIVNNLVNRNQLYAIFMMDRAERLREEAEHIFLKLTALFEKKMEIPLTLGVSRCSDCLSASCQREAKEALKQRLLHGTDNIYFYEDMRVLEAKHFPTSEFTMLERYMERRDIENIRKSIRRIFSEELTAKYGANYIQIMWVRVLSMALHNFGGKTLENERLEQLLSGFALVDELTSMQELCDELDGILMNCMREEGLKDANAKNKIRMAIAYMQENYNQNIAINELAERFDMSPNYFSSMFKKEMNQSAVNYLTGLRLDKAAYYLEHTDESVADISRRVGYEDNQYFFRVFKKVFGITPLMYRKEHRK